MDNEEKAASAEAPAAGPAGREEVAQLGGTRVERPRPDASQRPTVKWKDAALVRESGEPKPAEKGGSTLEYLDSSTGVTVTLAALRKALLPDE